LYAGIELSGVMVTRDGGATWEDRKPGSQHDAHAIATHPAAPGRVYEAAGGGVAVSDDAGVTWRPADEGMDRHYTWGLAIDAVDPDLWYVSASFGAHLAHSQARHSQGVLFRMRGTGPWEPIGTPDGTATRTDGLEAPLKMPNADMPYALLTLPDRPNTLVVGLRSGTLLVSDDAGDSFHSIALDRPIPGLLTLTAAPVS
ncbi:MAG: hypothetical protein M3121_07185, partial [Chloroflexota bacterium]|nr:hypothetical protein [Chloroflexota bacterium]